MSGAELSLLAVTGGFIALVLWVYWPSRRARLESYAAMPLDDAASDAETQDDARGRGGNRGERT